MTQIMLIDAEHPEELRVAVLENGTLSEFDYESTLKKQNKGNETGATKKEQTRAIKNYKTRAMNNEQ